MRSARLMVTLLILAPAILSRPASAQVNTFTENFYTTQYTNPATTAVWDTVLGEIRLPRFSFTPSILGGYDTPGQARAVAVDGDHAFVADGGTGLLVIDVTDPSAPVLLGTYNTMGNARGVAVDGDYAFVADYTYGLQVIDVTNTAAPALVGGYDTPGYARGVANDGDLVFVADGPSGLQVIEFAGPGSTTLLGTYDTAGDAQAVAVAGNTAYVADYLGGLVILDVSDPSNPSQIADYSTGGNAVDVAADGDYVFLCDASTGLNVVDVSVPAAPATLGSLSGFHSIRQVAIDGDYAFVADDDSGLVAVDVSVPTTPQLAWRINTPGLSFDVAVDGEFGYVADWGSGVHAVRVAEYVPPTKLSSVSQSNEAWDIELFGDYALLTGGQVSIYDITTPTSPTLVNGFAGLTDTYTGEVVDNLAYVYDAYWGLVVLDISDPTTAWQLSQTAIDGQSGEADIEAVGEYVYFGCTDPDSGLYVYDVSTPTSPVRVAQLPLSYSALDLETAGDYLYAACWVAGLLVVDVTDPTNPVLAGSYNTPGAARGVAVAGDYAYVGDGNSLRVLDISDPSNPSEVGSDLIYYQSHGVSLSGDYAVVGNVNYNVSIFDISDPTSPWKKTEFYGGFAARCERVSGDYMYVGGDVDRMTVAQFYQRGGLDFDSNRAISGSVHESDNNIVRARLVTDQRGTIDWSVESGGVWYDVEPGADWVTLTLSGHSLKWDAYLRYTEPGVYPSCSNLQIEWQEDVPLIDTITDVANDQGRQVSVSWIASGWDHAGSPTTITGYAVYRKIDYDLSGAAPVFKGDEPPLQRAYPPGDWHYLTTVPARGEDRYAVVVPTLADSTIADGMYYSTFFVSALTDAPTTYFDSPPDSGYSVDNLSPSVPTSFAVAYNNTTSGNYLSWDECPEADFQYFRVYRSTNPAFPTTVTEMIQATTGTDWTDPTTDGWRYHYAVASVDFSGNESDWAMAGTVTAGDEPPPPASFALHPNTPNPFNPTTVIHYDVPAGGGRVTIRVYDVGGRLVRALVDRSESAGAKTVAWQGRDDSGRPVASGVYFYRMTAPGYEETRKMVLTK